MILLGKLLTLVVVSVLCGEGSYQGDYALPVMVFEEGDTALVPCIKEANENDFFWSKGKWYNNGTNIAYIARGIPSESEKYDVHIDGTLVIHRISLIDEGNYFCRILSESTESYIGVRILLKINAESLDIAIEGCTSSLSCLKVLKPSLEFSLTCSANTRSESMTLKWYNGSEEIIGNVDVSGTIGQMAKITNVITFMFEVESYLTCEAEGVNIAKSMAVIHLKKEEVESETTLAILVSTTVLGIICLILTCILICLTIRNRKLNKVQGKVKDVHSTEMNLQSEKSGNDKNEDQTGEEHSLITSKEENGTDLATKERQLKRLQTEMRETKLALEENKRELTKATEVLQKREYEAQNLRKDLEEAKAVISEKEKKNLQKDLKEANTKLVISEKEKLNLHKELEEELVISKKENMNLQKDLGEAKTKFVISEKEKMNLQKGLEEAKTKLVISEKEKKNFQKDLKEANTKLVISEKEKLNLQKDLEGAKKEMVISEKEKMNLQKDLEEANTKLVISEKEKMNLQKDLGEAKTKLVISEKKKKDTQKSLSEMKDKL